MGIVFVVMDGLSLMTMPREQRPFIDEADGVAEWVSGPEHSLSPRHLLDPTFDDGAPHIERPLVARIKIRYGEIDVLLRVVFPPSLETVTVRNGIVASKYSPAAIKIMAAG
jgi:hypothetical protein